VAEPLGDLVVRQPLVEVKVPHGAFPLRELVNRLIKGVAEDPTHLTPRVGDSGELDEVRVRGAISSRAVSPNPRGGAARECVRDLQHSPGGELRVPTPQTRRDNARDVFGVIGVTTNQLARVSDDRRPRLGDERCEAFGVALFLGEAVMGPRIPRLETCHRVLGVNPGGALHDNLYTRGGRAGQCDSARTNVTQRAPFGGCLGGRRGIARVPDAQIGVIVAGRGVLRGNSA
jgi:hypothetical protein